MNSVSFDDDEQCWQAVVNRNPLADGVFYYSVRTTGVYCRATCASRLPLRDNVQFYKTRDDAERAGFRACKRCRPTENALEQRQTELVERACRLMENSPQAPSLDELAKSAGLSRHHFHRLFKAHTGVTPKSYATALRNQKVKNQLDQRTSVTQAIYGSGFSSSGRFYESSTSTLGMTPKTYRAGGVQTSIRFAVGECKLGSVLVAATDHGVCAILLGDNPNILAQELQDRFPNADFVGGDALFENQIAQVIGLIENPTTELHLPLDIQGTAFQQRVWQALRQIPPGSTATYTQIANQIGQPQAVRAVAQACAANPIAVAIPCHRVIRTDGALSGYRWGVERKSELLRLECQ